MDELGHKTFLSNTNELSTELSLKQDIVIFRDPESASAAIYVYCHQSFFSKTHFLTMLLLALLVLLILMTTFFVYFETVWVNDLLSVHFRQLFYVV